MANLTFAISKNGLIAPVLVDLTDETKTDLDAKGLPIPTAIMCRGLVDTGSDASAVAPWVIQRLGLGPGIPASTQTAGGMRNTAIHWIRLDVLNPNHGQPDLTFPSIMVSELTAELSDAEVLIGLDTLIGCNFFLEGPLQRFTFAF
jgi:hypothetical protein